MKPIELTEEHKNKLLEMCKALFPELENLEVRDSMEDFCLPFEHICIEYGRNKKLVIIHWFEFCMTELSHKILFKLCNNFEHVGTADLEIETTMEWNNNLFDTTLFHKCNPSRNERAWHPIDYLYQEFKKLKQL